MSDPSTVTKAQMRAAYDALGLDPDRSNATQDEPLDLNFVASPGGTWTELHADTALTAAQEIRLQVFRGLVGSNDFDDLGAEVLRMAHIIETGEPDDPDDARTERCPGCEHEIKRMRGQLADANEEAAMQQRHLDAVVASNGLLERQRDAVLAMCDEIDRYERGSLDEHEVRAVLASDPGDPDGMPEPCQPIGCDNGYHIGPGCVYAAIDGAGEEER